MQELGHYSALLRRDVLQGLGTLVVGAVVPGCNDSRTSVDAGPDARIDAASDAATDAGPDASVVNCVLTPTQVEGPFFLDTGLDRVDITEGKPGVALRVQLTFVTVDGQTCSPIQGAVAELWHTDASGAYSGFDIADGNLVDAAGETFCRGFQTTGAEGVVTFDTIYPGWYPGRTPHMHLLALLGQNRLVTTQLYFDESLTDSVYQQAPYSARGPRDTTNAQDAVSRFGDGPGPDPLIVNSTPAGAGYNASFVIGIASNS